MKTLISLTIILLCTLVSCKKDDQNNQLGAVNSTFQIELISNPSTGYSWKWVNKESITIVDSANHNFTPYHPDRKGSSGIETWKFLGKTKGTEVLEFKYNRSWDPNSTVDEKAITITVN